MDTIDRRQLLKGAAALAVTTALATEGATMPAAAAHGPMSANLGEPQPLDGRPFPAYDYTRANKLPREMTGYWTKSFDIAGTTRTAKAYISPETPIRSYYTVIAVPDGVDTAEFLRGRPRGVRSRTSGKEGLFVLEPGPDGWGDTEDEAAYLEAAMSFYQNNRYFSIFGLHYLVGYGGGQVTQNFAIAFPEYFAAVASTSFTAAPDASGQISVDGVPYPASGRMIPNYHIYGYGDLEFLEGTLWDNTQNRLDSWAHYHLQVNGLTLSDVDTVAGRRSGWHDRFQTWTWNDRDAEVPVLKLTKNLYRSHNTMAEESPMLWDFLKHYSHEIDAAGNVTRYYSRSAFRRPGDRKRL